MAVTGKRKRPEASPTNGQPPASTHTTILQIITGSYERTLHGFSTTLPPQNVDPREIPVKSKDLDDDITFEDTFLFNAHSSSIRCLALSPPSGKGAARKRTLATGGADERINLYSISAATALTQRRKDAPNGHMFPAPTRKITNREIGSLAHHTSTVTALCFPSATPASSSTASTLPTQTESKSAHQLLSTSLDNSLTLTRTRDWSLLASLKAPLPTSANIAASRPSGDTSTPADVPAGISAVAVHPSARVAVSVGRGERCLRLWDLVRGKRAGVLQFPKAVLEAIGEGKKKRAAASGEIVGGGTGEGRAVCWRGDGAEFAVGFERGVLVYNGDECVVRGVVRLGGRNRVCAVQYVRVAQRHLLALSTEDGRVLFYDTSVLAQSSVASAAPPAQSPIAQLGAPTRNRRVKDFVVLQVPTDSSSDQGKEQETEKTDEQYFVITACSDGAISIWNISASELDDAASPTSVLGKTAKKSRLNGDAGNVPTGVEPTTTTAEDQVKNVGTFRGTYETGRRITCVVGFVMDAVQPVVEGVDAVEDMEEIGGDIDGDAVEQGEESSDDEEDGEGNGVVIYEDEMGEEFVVDPEDEDEDGDGWGGFEEE